MVTAAVVVRQSDEWNRKCARVGGGCSGGGGDGEGGGRGNGQEPSAGKRRKGSEFFIGKNSIRERKATVFVIGHPRGEDGRVGQGVEAGERGSCPAQRYPSIRRTVDPQTVLESTPFLHSISWGGFFPSFTPFTHRRLLRG